ncbi:hypothetical protein QM012_005367 [Aureobasidium pullulans]|uniref:Uncharacterized protein n=1 Tax=Aureobasidium pullulans TaxID=5580 RepID=A0ABR0T5M1_AURPU
MSPPNFGQRITLPIHEQLYDFAKDDYRAQYFTGLSTITNQHSKDPVDTPNQTPTKGPEPISATQATTSFATKDDPPASIEHVFSKPSETSNALIRGSDAMFLPAIHSESLPFGEKFRLNEPRPLSILVSMNRDLDGYEMRPYPGTIDFSDEKQVQTLNSWRVWEIRRALMRLKKYDHRVH